MRVDIECSSFSHFIQAENLVIFRTISAILCWNLGERKLEWESEIEGDGLMTPKTVVIFQDKVICPVYHENYETSLIAFSLTSGEVLWKHSISIRPHSDGLLFNENDLLIYGTSKDRGHYLSHFDLGTLNETQIRKAPKSQFLFSVENQVFIAGETGIFQYLAFGFNLISSAHVFGSLLWKGQRILAVKYSEIVEYPFLSKFRPADLQLERIGDFPPSDPNSWLVKTQCGEVIFAHNSETLDLLVFTQEGKTIFFKGPSHFEDFTIHSIVFFDGHWIALGIRNSTKKLRLVELEENELTFTCRFLDDIMFPRILGGIQNNYLAIGGLAGITILSPSDF